MIYCVEDDLSVREIEVYTLRSTGFEAMGFENGEDFFRALEECVPELVILDVMLPGEDGTAILKRLRSSDRLSKLPIIMATAKGTEYDRILGLDLGADDYLVKPFSMLEMVSRVRAVLRRSVDNAKNEKDELSAGNVKLNISGHCVTVSGEKIVLTFKEFELLKILLENPHTVFTRDRLLNDIWGIDFTNDTRTVDVHIRTLRQKLGSGADIIGTVRGVGYCIEDKTQ